MNYIKITTFCDANISSNQKMCINLFRDNYMKRLQALYRFRMAYLPLTNEYILASVSYSVLPLIGTTLTAAYKHPDQFIPNPDGKCPKHITKEGHIEILTYDIKYTNLSDIEFANLFKNNELLFI